MAGCDSPLWGLLAATSCCFSLSNSRAVAGGSDMVQGVRGGGVALLRCWCAAKLLRILRSTCVGQRV